MYVLHYAMCLLSANSLRPSVSGLLLSIVLVPAIHQTSKHRIAIYVARTVAFVGACVMFGVLLNNFFQSDPNSACEWCRYLSCWPTTANNVSSQIRHSGVCCESDSHLIAQHCKGTGLTMTDSATSGSTTTTGADGTIGASTNSNVALAVVSVLSILVTRSHYRK